MYCVIIIHELLNRWDTSIDESVYNDPTKMGPTLASIRACANKPSNAPTSDRLGVKHQPLLDIEPSQIIPDELHLLLRIGDVLVRNLIFEVVTAARQQRRSPQFLLSSLRQVEAAAAACGITFKIWEVKD